MEENIKDQDFWESVTASPNDMAHDDDDDVATDPTVCRLLLFTIISYSDIFNYYLFALLLHNNGIIFSSQRKKDWL